MGLDFDTIAAWLISHPPVPDKELPGLHFGTAGVAVALAEAISAKLIEPTNAIMEYIQATFSGTLDWYDLTHGAAGQGIAAIICMDRLPQLELDAFVDHCVGYLTAHQEPDGSWQAPAGVPSLKGTVFTGFAHGTAGILYFFDRSCLPPS